MSRSKAKGQGDVVIDNFSIIQLNLKASRITQSKIKGLAADLNISEANLLPIPIQKFEFNLLSGIESIGKKVVLASHLNSSYDNEGSDLWEEKNITIQLSKEAAQLVDDNLEKFNELGLVFAFSYFTNFSSLIEEDLLKNPEENHDTKENETELIQFKSGLVDLSFDVDRWKDSCIKELVLNEEVLPRYHPIQLICYDFSDRLRPDLLAKKVIICGAGLGNRQTCTKELEFSATEPDLNAISLKFKFPILFNKPLRYRVTEIDLTGNVSVKQWINVDLGHVVDISTPNEEMKFDTQSIEVQTDILKLKSDGFREVSLTLKYLLEGYEKTKRIVFDTHTSNEIVSTNIYYDKGSALSYDINWMHTNGNMLAGDNSMDISTGFVFLAPPKNEVIQQTKG
ncbi:hypothetical protein JQC67_16815 [Aurantibacter crassamenti]|uniref:hypothetical protein n=1 Tax=Aurantibacter crassamenti TaxID=1837375 RepID=UPI00193A8619|nr:hypothetical protein [Aurantibacter crassamenti]MBM1107819.1 hypothetical protein [Aurantibacter crassamenti]